jgi:hypothetical protein
MQLKYGKNLIYYEVVNGKVRLYGNTLIKYVRIKDNFVDPEKVNDANCGQDGVVKECYNDDMEFPCPADLIDTIVDILIRRGAAFIQTSDDVEIDIKPEQSDRD